MLVEYSYSCRFGNFMMNSERERKEVSGCNTLVACVTATYNMLFTYISHALNAVLHALNTVLHALNTVFHAFIKQCVNLTCAVSLS